MDTGPKKWRHGPGTDFLARVKKSLKTKKQTTFLWRLCLGSHGGISWGFWLWSHIARRSTALLDGSEPKMQVISADLQKESTTPQRTPAQGGSPFRSRRISRTLKHPLQSPFSPRVLTWAIKLAQSQRMHWGVVYIQIHYFCRGVCKWMIAGEGNVHNIAKAACFTVFSDSILLL